ncbi:hypothetical protein [Pararhizobium sp. IMCC21322]|uniref:hypothetical protein n=1 Tax=Pararhizobium sp. IMCC21322 TaxID=3067903 RepID=UPI002742143B|nr:hypothetical protein [Pararhizobium sp. IMCC21322]
MGRQKKDIMEFLFMTSVVFGAIYLFAESRKIAPPEYEILGPAFMPRILVIAVGGFAAFLAAQKLISWIRSEAPNSEPIDAEARIALTLSQIRFGAILILLAVFITTFALQALPYWACATLFLILSHLVLSSGTPKQIILSVVVAVVSVSAIYVLATSFFDKVLN